MNQQQKPLAHSEQIKTFEFHKEHSNITSLPFITTNKNKSGRNWFDMPVTGNYTTDCRTGSLCATMLIKAMRDDKEYCGGCLQNIVLSLLESKGSKQELRGVIVGFFSELNIWLHWTANQTGNELDDETYQQLIEKVVTGLREAK